MNQVSGPSAGVSVNSKMSVCSARGAALGGEAAGGGVLLETVAPAEVVVLNEAEAAEVVGTVIGSELFEVAEVVTVAGSLVDVASVAKIVVVAVAAVLVSATLVGTELTAMDLWVAAFVAEETEAGLGQVG